MDKLGISKREFELICIGAHEAKFSYGYGESDKFTDEIRWSETPEWIREIERLRVGVALSNQIGFSRNIHDYWVDQLAILGFTLGENCLSDKKYSEMKPSHEMNRAFHRFDDTALQMFEALK
jgi:hypothetical protein